MRARPRPARLIRGTVAAGGLGVVVYVLLILPAPRVAAPAWVWRFFVAWAVGVPYWHFIEYRLLRDPAAGAPEQAEFRALQQHSRAVWLGVLAVLAVVLLRG